MKRFNLAMTDEEWDAVESLQQEHGETATAIIRRAIRMAGGRVELEARLATLELRLAALEMKP